MQQQSPALSRIIAKASEHCQLWVLSHANRLINALNQFEDCNLIELDKQLGQTEIVEQDMLTKPSWHWKNRS